MPASFDHLRTIARAAVTDGVVPGLVVLVGQDGLNRHVIAAGHRQLEPRPLPVSEETVWDLASLTKALCTSVLCMQAVGERLAALADPLPDLAPPVSLRQLLCHAGGFAAHLPFYGDLLGPGGAGAGEPGVRAALLTAIRNSERVAPPGTRAVYSDLGFILLGDWLERTLGDRLDHLFLRRVAQPLGIAGQLAFRTQRGPLAEADAPDVAATERCPVRGRVLVGEVHDLNAYALGGVAGHAGLFGTAGAVAVLAHALCAAYRPGVSGDPGLVDAEVLRTFWSPSGIKGSNWRLGWDGPAPAGSLAGDRFSRKAVGHLAFTGCSLWIDPAAACFVLVLCNRVHPVVREDPRFRELRRALNDAALEGLGYSG